MSVTSTDNGQSKCGAIDKLNLESRDHKTLKAHLADQEL